MPSRPLNKSTHRLVVETFGLDPARAARRTAADARELTGLELQHIVRTSAIGAVSAHDVDDRKGLTEHLLRLQLIVAEMAWRLDPRGERDAEYRDGEQEQSDERLVERLNV